MRKIVLFAIVFTSFLQGAFALDLHNTTDGWYSSFSTGDWVWIYRHTSDAAYMFTFSTLSSPNFFYFYGYLASGADKSTATIDNSKGKYYNATIWEYYCDYRTTNVLTGQPYMYWPIASSYVCANTISVSSTTYYLMNYWALDGWGNTVPATCTDQIQNQDETGIDYGGVCWNQTCGIETMSTLVKSVVYTGSYSSQTVTKYGTGTSIDTSGGYTDYVEDIIPPSSWSGYLNEETQYRLHGAYITGWSGSFNDLYNKNLHIIVPGYLQSPLQSTAFAGWQSWIDIAQLSPPQYGWIIWQGTGVLGSLNPAYVDSMWPPTYFEGKGCLKLERSDNTQIFDKNYPNCYPVTTLTNYPNGWFPLQALKKSTDGFYHIRFILPDSTLDQEYKFQGLEIGNYTKTYYPQYICHNKVTGDISSASGSIGTVDYQTRWGGTGATYTDQSRPASLSGTLTASMDFSFWTLPSVSSGADCSQIFLSGAFLYGNANSKFTWAMTSGQFLWPKRWSCTILTSDICWTVYDVGNGFIGSIFSIFGNGIVVAGDVIKNSLSYIGTPEEWKNYCFAGKNWVYTGRPSSYSDVKWNSHTITVSTLTLLDLLVLSILSWMSIYLIIRK